LAYDKFAALPIRLFLDSSTLQTLEDYSEYIYDNGDIDENATILRRKKGFENLEALRNIFSVLHRASYNFELAISRNSLFEVQAKGDPYYLKWTYDILDHWTSCIDSYERSEAFSGKGVALFESLNEMKFLYLSNKDRLLIFDALKLECDAFLTMEEKLPKNAEHFKKELAF
jgi:hypothetical protein